MINQILVQLGDKEPSFVGSRKWIGSTEVSYVLDHLLGVSFSYHFSLRLNFENFLNSNHIKMWKGIQ